MLRRHMTRIRRPSWERMRMRRTQRTRSGLLTSALRRLSHYCCGVVYAVNTEGCNGIGDVIDGHPDIYICIMLLVSSFDPVETHTVEPTLWKCYYNLYNLVLRAWCDILLVILPESLPVLQSCRIQLSSLRREE
jgi:hypothetical protein